MSTKQRISLILCVSTMLLGCECQEVQKQEEKKTTVIRYRAVIPDPQTVSGRAIECYSGVTNGCGMSLYKCKDGSIYRCVVNVQKTEEDAQ